MFCDVSTVRICTDLCDAAAGVDDNGSGMAALLETARVLTSVAESCTFDTTIIFAALDLQRKVSITAALYGYRPGAQSFYFCK